VDILDDRGTPEEVAALVKESRECGIMPVGQAKRLKELA